MKMNKNEADKNIGEVCYDFSENLAKLSLSSVSADVLKEELKNLQENLGKAPHKDKLTKHDILAIRGIQNSVFTLIDDKIASEKERNENFSLESTNEIKKSFQKVFEEELLSNQDQKVNNYLSLLPETEIENSFETKALISVLNKTYAVDLDSEAILPTPINSGDNFDKALQGFIKNRAEMQKVGKYTSYESEVSSHQALTESTMETQAGSLIENSATEIEIGVKRNNVVLPIQVDKKHFAAVVDNKKDMFIALAELVQFSTKKPDISVIDPSKQKEAGRVIIGKVSECRKFFAKAAKVFSFVLCFAVAAAITMGVSALTGAAAAVSLPLAVGVGLSVTAVLAIASVKAKKNGPNVQVDIDHLARGQGAKTSSTFKSTLALARLVTDGLSDAIEYGGIKAVAKENAFKVIGDKYGKERRDLMNKVKFGNPKEKKAAGKELKSLGDLTRNLAREMIKEAVQRTKEFESYIVAESDGAYHLHDQGAFKVSTSPGKAIEDGKEVKTNYKDAIKKVADKLAQQADRGTGRGV